MNKSSVLIPTRFKNIKYYSQDLSKSIEQFKDDITKLYMHGLSYDEVMAHKKAKYVNARLRSIHTVSENNPSSGFPSLKTFINYVYTRDEVNSLFGHWFEFDYMEPIRILQYSQSIKEKLGKSGEQLSIITMSSIVFILLKYFNFTSGKDLKEARFRLRKAISKEVATKRQKSLFKEFAKSGKYYNNRPVRFYKPSYMYNLAGVYNYLTFDKYVELLGCSVMHENRKKHDGYRSEFWVFGIESLYKSFYSYCNSISLSINISDEELLTSGIKFPAKLIDRIDKFYNNILLRDKKHRYPYSLYHNPIIRLQKEKDKTNCYIQSSFFNFNFILGSLYIHTKEKRNRIKPIIGKELNESIRETILCAAKEYDIITIEDTLKESSISFSLKPISTPNDLTNSKHFDQIRNSQKVIKQIQSNGIYIDTNKAKLLLKSYERARKKRHVVRASNSDRTFEVVDDDDNPIPEHERVKSIDEKIREIEKILNHYAFEHSEVNRYRRIFGLFTPHGASTHRMTSRNINLQGISKDIRKYIVTAPQNFKLLSADISGQDIVIAASMAKRLYSRPELFPKDDHEILAKLNKEIDITISLLSNKDDSCSRPIDYILDNIIGDSRFEGLKRETIRDLLKKAVFSFFYGGGIKTFSISKTDSQHMRKELIDLCEQCHLLEKAFTIDNRLKNFNLYKIIKEDSIFEMAISISEFLSIINKTYVENPALSRIVRQDLSEEINDICKTLDPILQQLKEAGIRNYIFSRMTEIIKITYPGLLESYEYYKKYYQINQLTYPTFLGWQTVVMLEYDVSKMTTRSKCYPVQASGAEFMRQWILEFDKLVLSKKVPRLSYKLVNAIHDQLLVEIHETLTDKMYNLMVEAARQAAIAIGINPNMLYFKKKVVGRN